MSTEPEPTVDLGVVSVPAEITRTWESVDAYRGYTVTLTARYDADSGRHLVERVVVEAGPEAEITSEGIRRLPVKELLRHAIADQVGPLNLARVREAGKAGPTTETLQEVAAVYRLAVAFGDPPTVCVADTLGVPRSTAARWVTRARDRGYLTVTDPRATPAGER